MVNKQGEIMLSEIFLVLTLLAIATYDTIKNGNRKNNH